MVLHIRPHKVALQGRWPYKTVTVNDRFYCIMVLLYDRYFNCVDLLLKAGADVNMRVNNGRTAIFQTAFSTEEAMRGELESFGWNYKPDRQSLVKCAEMFIKGGADVNVVDPDYNTPLLLTARCGNYPCLRLYIQAGADVNKVKADTGETALVLATRMGHLQCVDELLAAGARDGQGAPAGQ